MADKLLKDAIADAKAVRETALANAKLAIQEAFTPKLQSMISSRLRNEAEEEEGTEGDFSKEPDEEVPIGLDTVQKEIDPTVAKTEDEAVDVTADQGQDPEKEKAGKVADSPKAVGGVEQFEEEAEPIAGEEIPGEEDAEIETDDQNDDETDAELEAIIKELDMEGGDETDEEPVLDEPTEVPAEEEPVAGADEIPGDDEKDEATDVTADAGQDVEKGKGSAVAPGAGSGSDTGEEQGSTEVELDLEKLVKEVEDELGAEEEENDEKPEELDIAMKENVKLSKQLKEHRKVIEFLRSKLNEINLLNAKLLFSNKLFRSNSLTEAQRLHIIESIDRANSVREVKLVYATLAEAFKSRIGLTESTKKAVKSSASKTIPSTKPTKPILAEGADLAARFKKLSGNKKISRIL